MLQKLVSSAMPALIAIQVTACVQQTIPLSAKITRIEPIGLKTLRVSTEVENRGDAAADVSCSIELTSPGRQSVSFSVLWIDMAPGEKRAGEDEVSVPRTTGYSLENSTIDCSAN